MKLNFTLIMKNSFFIVESGEVDVEIDQKVVRSLNKGQTFG